MRDFPFGTPSSGDDMSRELFDAMRRELVTLRELHTRAREIFALVEERKLRRARRLIADYRLIDPSTGEVRPSP